MLPPLDRERRAVEQLLVARAQRQVLDHDDVAARPRGLQELEPERPAPVVRRVDAHRLELLDLLELRLRLARLARLVAEPLDEALEARDLLGLPLGRLRLVDRASGPLAPPDVPRAREVDRLAAFQLQHRSRHRLEEPAVVGDEDDRRIERLEQLLQPLERLDVEVVRRLVEQQQVGLRRESAGERGTGQLAPRERRERPVEVGIGEAEPAHERRGPVAPVVAARVLELRLGRGVAAHRRGVVRAGRHRLLEPAQLRLDGGEVGRCPRGRSRAASCLLWAGGRWSCSAIRVPFAEREVAALERHLARERAQQCRLAGAVRARERQAVAPLDLERDAVEEDAARELLAKGRSDDDRHGLKLSTRAPRPDSSDPDRRRTRRRRLPDPVRAHDGRRSRSIRHDTREEQRADELGGRRRRRRELDSQPPERAARVRAHLGRAVPRALPRRHGGPSRPSRSCS